MHDFLQLIFHMLQRGGKLALAAVLFAALGVGLAYLVYRLKRQPGDSFPWGKALAALLLAGYLTFLLYVTLLRQVGVGRPEMSLRLFLAWREAWNNFSLQRWLNVLLNVALFLPLGFLLPLLGKVFRGWLTPILGLAVSLAIETAQYLLARGMFDVDDLFTNALGAALGFCCSMTFLRLFPGRNKPRRGWAPYLAGPMAFAVFLLAMFGWYQVKPYGNLREAPVYSYDLRGLSWQVQCELPDQTQRVPTYWAEPFTKDTCEVFGADFAKTAGIEFPDAYYYDDLTVFANHSTGDFLNVTYHDRSYEFTLSRSRTGEEALKTPVTAPQLREQLDTMGIHIPPEAAFTDEGENRYLFTVNMMSDGEYILNGTVRCELLESGFPRKIESTLVPLSPYREEDIITPQEAFECLQRGKFQDAEGLARLNPEAVTVLSCTLAYRADTKGYYQPVYEFLVDLTAPDFPGLTTGTYIVPAMK